jgi:hypothetical protein
MQIHHAMAHDESLVKKETTCTNDSCNTKFEYYPSNKEGKLCYSCVKEQNLHYSTEENNRVKVECEQCGEGFKKVRSEIERTDSHYCSTECRDEDFGVPRISLKCSTCAEVFEIPEWLAEDRKYCSKECYHSRQARREVECRYCGDPKSIPENEFLKDRDYFCSQQCYLNHRREKGHINVRCANCENELTIKRYRAQRSDRIFCDDDCRIEWQSNESNPRYVGGLSGYGTGWFRA